MSIKTKRFQDSKKAIEFLEQLALESQDTLVFRGHSKEEYRLESTWHRDGKIPIGSEMERVDDTLNKFTVGMQKLGLGSSFNHDNRLEPLENGRHYGLPSPCLDFSYSPYVALFFAFNGVKQDYKSKKNKYSVVYALNINKLATFYAKNIVPELETKEDEDKRREVYFSFMKPKEDLFREGFPANVLQFIPYPGKNNTRMQRQLGALLYDSLIYYYLKIKDLEEFIGDIKEADIISDDQHEPTLYKILINQKCVSNIFHRLELMNITGGNLYCSGEGVVMDMGNAKNYNPKFSYLRDIKMPKATDGKAS